MWVQLELRTSGSYVQGGLRSSELCVDAGNRAEDNLILLPHPRPRGLSGELALTLDSREYSETILGPKKPLLII